MRLHYSLLITFVFALYTNMVYEFIVFFLCIIFHELGHLFFVLIFKQKVNYLSLSIFGGELNCYFINLSWIQSFLIYSGGIIASSILILLSPYLPFKIGHIINHYNSLLIFFNLLPVYPLDGYRICEQLLGIFFNPHLEFTIISFLALFTLLGLFIYAIIMKSLGFIIIIIFLLINNIERIINRDKIIIRKFIAMFS